MNFGVIGFALLIISFSYLVWIYFIAKPKEKGKVILDPSLLKAPEIGCVWLTYAGARLLWINRDFKKVFPNATQYKYTFHEEYYGRAEQIEFLNLNANDIFSKFRDKHLEDLLRVYQAGFLAEYVWHYFYNPVWQMPNNLRLQEFQNWSATNLINHQAIILANVEVSEDELYFTESKFSKIGEITSWIVIVICIIGLFFYFREPTVAELMQKLEKEKVSDKVYAIKKLGKKGKNAVVAIPKLIKFLESKDKKIADLSVESLAKIGKPALPQLLVKLHAHPYPVRLNDVFALMGEPAVAPLIEKFQTDNKRICTLVAKILIKIGKPAVKPLTQFLSSDKKKLRKISALCLVKIGEPAVNSTIDVLLKKNKRARTAAKWILIKIGEKAIPGLLQAFTGPDSKLARYSKKIILSMEKNYHKIIPQIIFNIKKNNFEKIENLIIAMGENAIPSLSGLLIKTEKNSKKNIARIVAKMGKKARTMIPTLILCLNDKDATVRQVIAETLGKLGPIAKSATSELEKLLKDRDKYVRTSAKLALKKIRG